MNWYKKIFSQITPHFDSAKRELPSIQQMIENLGREKGFDPLELAEMIREAERYLKTGYDAERIRSVMLDRLKAA